MDEVRIYREFGQRVAAVRTAHQLTQADLAQRVNLSRASIANIERGEQRVLLHYAYVIAAALGLRDVRELLPVDVEEPASETPVQIHMTDGDFSDEARRQIELIYNESGPA